MQLVVLTPVLVLLIVFGIQLAVYFHAANVASAAAGEGASAGAAEAAARTVSDLGSSLAASPSVTDDGAFVVVSVEVSVPSLLPGFDLSVTRTVRVPRERFVTEADR